MRRATPLLLLIVAAGTPAAMAASQQPMTDSSLHNSPRVIPIRWKDTQIVGGGQLIYQATSIRITSDRFTITASVTNRTGQSVAIRAGAIVNPQPGTVYPLSFGIAYREPPNPNITTRRFIDARATEFAPHLPESLAPSATWKGTFSGRTSALRHHHQWWIVYGFFSPGGYWITDHSFST